MRTLRLAVLAPIVLVPLALAASTPRAAADDTGLAGRITATADGAPIDGANVLVVAGGAYVASATTDADGRYHVALRPGAYDVILVSGHSRRTVSTTVPAGARATVDAHLGTAPSEVIVLEDFAPAAVPPRPTNFRKSRLLPYSDEAVLTDAWSRAWFLLDISATGRVTRVKFLHRPGHDLDDIALRAAFALRFQPSRDAAGRPIRVTLVWSFEWPANSFVLALTGLRTRKPDDVGFPPRPADAFVPCRGSGPMRLGSLVYKGFKDCTQPDLAKAPALPWIDAP